MSTQAPVIRNETEKKLLIELTHQGEAVRDRLKQLQRVQHVQETYKVLWQQLLVCRRANLMSLIPLTDQRLQQLTATADSLATSIQAQLEAMRPQMDGLALFASANQSTAEELMQTTGAEALAAEKLKISKMELQLIDTLTTLAAAAACPSHLQGNAATAGSQPQQQQQHQQSLQLPVASSIAQESTGQLLAGQGLSSQDLSRGGGPQQKQQAKQQQEELHAPRKQQQERLKTAPQEGLGRAGQQAQHQGAAVLSHAFKSPTGNTNSNSSRKARLQQQAPHSLTTSQHLPSQQPKIFRSQVQPPQAGSAPAPAPPAPAPLPPPAHPHNNLVRQRSSNLQQELTRLLQVAAAAAHAPQQQQQQQPPQPVPSALQPRDTRQLPRLQLLQQLQQLHAQAQSQLGAPQSSAATLPRSPGTSTVTPIVSSLPALHSHLQQQHRQQTARPDAAPWVTHQQQHQQELGTKEQLQHLQHLQLLLPNPKQQQLQQLKQLLAAASAAIQEPVPKRQRLVGDGSGMMLEGPHQPLGIADMGCLLKQEWQQAAGDHGHKQYAQAAAGQQRCRQQSKGDCSRMVHGLFAANSDSSSGADPEQWALVLASGQQDRLQQHQLQQQLPAGDVELSGLPAQLLSRAEVSPAPPAQPFANSDTPQLQAMDESPQTSLQPEQQQQQEQSSFLPEQQEQESVQHQGGCGPGAQLLSAVNAELLGLGSSPSHQPPAPAVADIRTTTPAASSEPAVEHSTVGPPQQQQQQPLQQQQQGHSPRDTGAQQQQPSREQVPWWSRKRKQQHSEATQQQQLSAPESPLSPPRQQPPPESPPSPKPTTGVHEAGEHSPRAGGDDEL